MQTPMDKLNRMKAGEKIITNWRELDEMLNASDDAIYSVRSLPNPDRCGLLDEYIAWIE